MTIYRGPGGTGEARTDTDVTEVRIIAEEALGYKNDAAASASAASASAAAADTAKTAAETAETNAETAEANAETAQAAAEAALASAQAVYDNFDDRYLGPKSSDPTVDNDGNALVTGALYFNTTVPEMRVYTGSAWIDFSAGATVSSFNSRTGDVTLTDTDVNTALGYTAANNSSVVHNTGTETVAGVKTFSSTIVGDISGNAGTVTNGVYTSGSYANPAWITSLAETKVLPSQTSNTGKYLTTNGTATSWATVDALPSQTGNTGKYLTTNGTAASWATINTDSNTTTKGLYENNSIISANYTITTGNNAMSSGPITVNSGITVTVPSGSRWVVL